MASVTLLIDADILLHKVSAVSEQEVDWGDEVTTIHSSHQQMKSLVTSTVKAWKDTLAKGNAMAVFCYSSRTNFRKGIYPEYKAHRTQRKPVGYNVVKQWLIKNANCQMMHGIEADDLLGMLQTGGKLGKTIVVSSDKDLLQIPGDVYNPDKEELVTVTPEMSYRLHMKQTLVGDRVDNYPGCPGIGEKRAEDLLNDHDPSAWWDMIVRCYEAKELTKEDALIQARLAKILHASDFDKKTRKPILWTPSLPTASLPTVTTAVSTLTSPAKAETKTKGAKSRKDGSQKSKSPRSTKKTSKRKKAAVKTT